MKYELEDINDIEDVEEIEDLSMVPTPNEPDEIEDIPGFEASDETSLEEPLIEIDLSPRKPDKTKNKIYEEPPKELDEEDKPVEVSRYVNGLKIAGLGILKILLRFWRFVVFVVLVITFVIAAYRILGVINPDEIPIGKTPATEETTEISQQELEYITLVEVIKLSEDISQTVFELNAYENLEFSKYTSGKHTDESAKIAVGISNRRKMEVLAEFEKKIDLFSSEYSQQMFLIGQMRLINGIEKSRTIIDGIDNKYSTIAIKETLNEYDIKDTQLKMQYNDILVAILDVIGVSYQRDEFNVYFILR